MTSQRKTTEQKIAEADMRGNAYLAGANEAADMGKQSALLAQMAAALKTIRFCWAGHAEECAYVKTYAHKLPLQCDCDWPKVSAECDAALTAYTTMSPDPLYVEARNTLAALELAESVYRKNVVQKGEPSSTLNAMQVAIKRARGEG